MREGEGRGGDGREGRASKEMLMKLVLRHTDRCMVVHGFLLNRKRCYTVHAG